MAIFSALCALCQQMDVLQGRPMPLTWEDLMDNVGENGNGFNVKSVD